jgi:hypothetical protein
LCLVIAEIINTKFTSIAVDTTASVI